MQGQRAYLAFEMKSSSYLNNNMINNNYNYNKDNDH